MTMRDDITPTNPEPIEVLAAQLEAFRKHPDDGDLYHELRLALRKSGQPEELAEIDELRAPHEQDPVRAADIWSEAGEARLHLGQTDVAEKRFRAALAQDPANERAAARYTEILMVNGRFADAASLMEREIVELNRRAAERPDAKSRRSEAFTARRANRHRMLAQLWDERLGRVDKALSHWQNAWKLEPDRTDALEEARKLYASLGDEVMVAKLYETEIETIGDTGPRPRRARLNLDLGRILARQGKLEAAAKRLEHALKLDPESTEIREALADVYSDPTAAELEDNDGRAISLFVELGNRRLATEDGNGAISYLRRALGVDPYSKVGTDALEKALRAEARWEELDRLYQQRAQLSDDDHERLTLLSRRANLYENELPNREGLKGVLAPLAASQPPGNSYAQRLRELYREDGDWTELSALIERELPGAEVDSARTAAELLELATIAREHLGDKERAAEILHRVLSVDPSNDEAISRYGDHFRERRDWRGLADLLDFGLETVRVAGAAPAELIRRLEEIAQVAELRLGDVARAILNWQRIQELEPENAKAREALKRLTSRAKAWDSVVGELERQAELAGSAHERAEALRRIAQVYRERQVNPRRAIAIYEEIFGIYPNDEGVLKALGELYEREADETGLAFTWRRQLDLDVRLHNQEAETHNRRPTPVREWPVSKRGERISLLRRLAALYERVADVEGLVYAATGILEIFPGDRDALERMERALEKSGDVARLEQTLEYHAASATGPAERTKVLRRLARIADSAGDEVKTMERWENALQSAPSDPDALAALALLYERHARWGELANVLERIFSSRKTPEPGTSDAATHGADLKRYASVVDEKLGDASRAIRAWQRVIEVSPKDRDALAALARLYEGAARWRDLAEILATQAPMYAADEPDKAAAIALRRATLLEERLGAPIEAAKALEAIIGELAPANLDAHRSLRRLYEARGDFESAVRTAEREMYLTTEEPGRIARGLEIGFLCRDRLHDPARSLQAFSRVLEIDPDHEEALTAAAELHARVGDWSAHVELLERRVDRVAAGRDRRALMTRIAHTRADNLDDHIGAFAWLREAHEHAPDASTILELRRAAETYGLWSELAKVYEATRTLLRPGGLPPTDDEAYVAASRELAAIAERRLHDRGRAISALKDALEVSPEDATLLSEVERIAAEGDDRALWKAFHECLALPLETGSREAKVALHIRRARVLEERLADGRGAVEELLKAFSWAPEREETRNLLYGLAERVRAWSDVVAVEDALAHRAIRSSDRIDILHRRAQVLEEKLKESVRAYRTYLIAFLVDPDHAETVAHLWRLARSIQTYREGDRTPRPEPAAAYVHAEVATRRDAPGMSPAQAPARRPQIRIQSQRPRREPTQELTEGELLDVLAGDLSVGDSTQPIEISELERVDETGAPSAKMSGRHRQDPTIELRTEDLIVALGARRPSADGGPPPPPGMSRVGTPGLPPPMQKRVPPPAPGSEARPIKRNPLPTLAMRSFESPWEELATAYESLAGRDASSKVRWLFKAAEIWESGAEDIDRAFDTLSRALSMSDDDAEPRARLHRLAGDHNAWDRLAELYEQAAEAADSQSAAVSLLVEVAEIRTVQGRTHETEGLYRRVLGMRPDDTAAREKLEELYRQEGRWVDLAASLEERTDPRLGSGGTAATRPTLLRELAAIYIDKLQRPHDAIEALDRLREMMPEDLEILEKLGDLHAQVGRWSKVIEVLSRIREIAEGAPEAREALRRVAGIYEKELELPDRAIDSYTALIASWPDDADAYAALDALYESHARWSDLADVLRRRAGLEREPLVRAELLRRRARIMLEWLDAPEEAAAALRHARTILPEDDDLADALIDALVRGRREREAAAVIEGRIAAAKKADVAGGIVAALLIRLSRLRSEHLADPNAARRALNEALEIVPNHPTALAAMAKLADASADPRAFAAAKLREAEAVTDVDAQVDALMAAGLALRDGVNDVPAARAAFEKVVALRPYHADATWALASLVEQGGDLDQAQKLLETRLEDETISVEERARILTQIAAISRRAGVDIAAETWLNEALNVKPDHVPAILGRADLLTALERHQELATFLESLETTVTAQPASVRAEVARRLALAYSALKRDDDAYQTLLGADKLQRGNLLIKLALGENRYRARRWREAALHLSSLATHEDASKNPAEVAEGLYHAALAEIRSLRADKAPPLYARALELKPNFAPALHAMAELAMEQGDARRAADLLTRQATATDDPAERVRLFEALGDMALMTLHDEDRARTCYEAAVNAASPLEARHLPLLEKLLERNDLAGDHRGAARTAELMASFGVDASARASRFAAAAENYEAAGDNDRARAAAERAVEADPYDITAVTMLTDLLGRHGDHERAAAVLGRALSGRDEGELDEITAARRAVLWNRLGDARRTRGDNKGAISAYEKSIAIASTSSGAMAARRQLLKLWTNDAQKREVCLEFMRVLAAESHSVDDVATYASALCKANQADAARIALAVAESLGHKIDVHQRAFLTGHPAPTLAADAAYRGGVDSAAHDALINDEDDEPLSAVFEALWEAAPLLWSEADDALERCAISGAKRISASTTMVAASVFPRVSAALKAPATMLYAADSAGLPAVQVVCLATPLIVVGPEAQSLGGSSDSEDKLRFFFGRAAELARPRRVIAAGLPRNDAANLLASVVRLFGDADYAVAIGGDVTDPEVMRVHDELLRTTLPVKLRGRLETLVKGLRPSDLNIDRYRATCERAANRSGLLAVIDPRTALEVAAALDDDTQHLVRTALDPRYLAVRASLGIASKG